jgi:hypothetical protein
VGDAGRLDGPDLLELHLRVPVELGSLFAWDSDEVIQWPDA